MSTLVSLGAFKKNTGEYVCPKMANKNDEYVCPDCGKDVFPRQGQILRHHFAHKRSDNPCNYYNHPGESDVHKEGKMVMKMSMEQKKTITIFRPCTICKKEDEFEIPEVDENSEIVLEYRFDHNGSTKSADVAYIDNKNVVCMIEVCHTHKTCSENRPEPWFEVDATNLINMVNEENTTSLKIPCIRKEKCEDCVEREIKEEKIQNIKKQKESIVQLIDLEQKQADKIVAWGMSKEEKSIRQRHKNHIKKWNEEIKILDDELDALMGIIKQKLSKQEKLYARYKNRDLSKLEADPEYNFINEDVEYTLSGNIFDITHPSTGQKIKLSNKIDCMGRNVFINGKWKLYKCWTIYVCCTITIDIIKWYHNDTDNIIDRANKTNKK